MRLHTNTITESDVHQAVENLLGVYATVTRHGSRSHDHALEIRLEGNGYLTNTGNGGAGATEGATWDEWGVMIARLYEIDPDALWGSAKYPVYRDVYHFHERTYDRFASGQMPENTHKRHKWDWGQYGARCTKCSAQIGEG